MLAFAGIPLGASAGGAFELAKPPDESAEQVVAEWAIKVDADVGVVVASGPGGGDYQSAHAAALSAAQRGLDLLSARGLLQLTIQGTANDHIVWWREPA